MPNPERVVVEDVFLLLPPFEERVELVSYPVTSKKNSSNRYFLFDDRKKRLFRG